MIDDHEHGREHGRRVLPWRRPRPDEPRPDEPTPDGRPVTRRHVGRNLFELVAGWFTLARELPVVLRLLLWLLVVLMVAVIFRTLRRGKA